MSQLAFDEETGKQLEALYRIGDAMRRRRLARAALAVKPGERVLDVGCGPGFYCAELLEEVGLEGSIVGLDSSASMLALAAHRLLPRDAKPSEVLVDRSFVFGTAANGIDILDAQQQAAAHRPRHVEIDQR